MESNLFSVVIASALAFAATNIDDIFLLALWFSQTDRPLPPASIVVGQYLGFASLVAVSMVGLFGSLVIPQTWIGLLGMLPLSIGIQKLFSACREKKMAGSGAAATEATLPFRKQNDRQRSAVWQVAGVTFANGGDNIGIYTPLFASSGFPQVLIILIVFFVLVAVWCALGYWFTREHVVGNILSQYSHQVVPFVLIGLGALILIESKSYQLFIR